MGNHAEESVVACCGRGGFPRRILRANCLCPVKAEKQARFAERVKESIVQLGVGEESYVTVKLRDKTKLAGYISEAREESFVVTNLRTSEATTVAYADVKKVKGHNLSTGAKVAIGVGLIALAVMLIIAAVLLWFTGGT